MDLALERFMEQATHLTPEQARTMRLAWEMEDPGPRQDAWQAAIAALRAAGRSGTLDELREAVNRWAGDKAFNFVDLYGGDSTERARQEARIAALPPVLDAGLVAIGGDLLDQDQRYALARPWRAAMDGGVLGRPRPGGRGPRRGAGR